MKDKLLRIGGGLMVSVLLYSATTYLKAQESELPITPPITPPTVTVTPTDVPSVTPTLTMTPTPTVTPTPVAGDDGHATGGVQATLDGANLKLNFNAFAKSKVENKGRVRYSSSAGSSFVGDVDVCYYQSGDEAAFAGHVKSGSASEEYFLVKVQDNGEGRNASPDMFGVWLTDVEPPCTLGGYPATVSKGNLQVH